VSKEFHTLNALRTELDAFNDAIHTDNFNDGNPLEILFLTFSASHFPQYFPAPPSDLAKSELERACDMYRTEMGKWSQSITTFFSRTFDALTGRFDTFLQRAVFAKAARAALLNLFVCICDCMSDCIEAFGVSNRHAASVFSALPTERYAHDVFDVNNTDQLDIFWAVAQNDEFNLPAQVVLAFLPRRVQKQEVRAQRVRCPDRDTHLQVVAYQLPLPRSLALNIVSHTASAFPPEK
jgi:hypothetical protein